MVVREYVPEAGDLVWVDFSPQAGREQAGRRPAVVLTARFYNQTTGLAVMCPITTHAKGYPFEVQITSGERIRGVVLADHLKNIDWRYRQAQKAGRIPSTTLDQVLKRVSILLGMT